jgi:hypothetical protein
MSGSQNAGSRHRALLGGDTDGRLPPGMSIAVIAVLSVLSWAALIGGVLALTYVF